MTPDDRCGCNYWNDWSDEETDAGECLVENGIGLACSLPSGHDGPHVACSVGHHPLAIYDSDDT